VDQLEDAVDERVAQRDQSVDEAERDAFDEEDPEVGRRLDEVDGEPDEKEQNEKAPDPRNDSCRSEAADPGDRLPTRLGGHGFGSGGGGAAPPPPSSVLSPYAFRTADFGGLIVRSVVCLPPLMMYMVTGLELVSPLELIVKLPRMPFVPFVCNSLSATLERVPSDESIADRSTSAACAAYDEYGSTLPPDCVA